jgi:hypothetical protein
LPNANAVSCDAIGSTQGFNTDPVPRSDALQAIASLNGNAAARGQLQNLPNADVDAGKTI